MPYFIYDKDEEQIKLAEASTLRDAIEEVNNLNKDPDDWTLRNYPDGRYLLLAVVYDD